MNWVESVFYQWPNWQNLVDIKSSSKIWIPTRSISWILHYSMKGERRKKKRAITWFESFNWTIKACYLCSFACKEIALDFRNTRLVRKITFFFTHQQYFFTNLIWKKFNSKYIDMTRICICFHFFADNNGGFLHYSLCYTACLHHGHPWCCFHKMRAELWNIICLIHCPFSIVFGVIFLYFNLPSSKPCKLARSLI